MVRRKAKNDHSVLDLFDAVKYDPEALEDERKLPCLDLRCAVVYVPTHMKMNYHHALRLS